MMWSESANFSYSRVITWLSLIALLLFAVAAQAGDKEAGEQLAKYLARARAMAGSQPETVGSLWTSQGPFAEMALDYKARNVNDLIVIHIVEQTRAQAAGSVQSQRTLEASSGISGLFGIVGPRSGLSTLFSPASDRAQDGNAQAASTTQLTTTLAGHVVEVLPNGSLVVEAAREVEMNNERQTLLLRGIVRPGDVSPGNAVLSTSISHLEVELKGKGVISDGVRPPNKIVRVLLRILGF